MAPKKTTSKKLSKEYTDLKEKGLSLKGEAGRISFLMQTGEATQEQKDKVLSELVDVNSQLINLL